VLEAPKLSIPSSGMVVAEGGGGGEGAGGGGGTTGHDGGTVSIFSAIAPGGSGGATTGSDGGSGSGAALGGVMPSQIQSDGGGGGGGGAGYIGIRAATQTVSGLISPSPMPWP